MGGDYTQTLQDAAAGFAIGRQGGCLSVANERDHPTTSGTVEPLLPDVHDVEAERRQARGVPPKPEVGTMPAQLPHQHPMLLRDRCMAVRTAPAIDRRQTTPKAVLGRLSLEHPATVPADAPVVREPQEVERAGSGNPAAVLRRAPPTARSAEPNQTALLRMHREPEPPEAFREHVKHPVGVRFPLHDDDQSSRPGESHPQALTEPDMNVSAHPALTVQPLLDATSASGQRAPGRRPRWPVSGAPSAGDAAASVCISLPPNGPTVGQGTEAWGKAPMDSTDRSTSATPG